MHTRESQLSITADDGTITDRRIETGRDRFTRGIARILSAARRQKAQDF